MSQLPEWLRIRLGGKEEAHGKTLGRLEACWREKDGVHRLFTCCGEFTETIGDDDDAASRRVVRRLDREQAHTLVFFRLVVPALREAVPPSFSGEFGLDPSDPPKPAMAKEILAA